MNPGSNRARMKMEKGIEQEIEQRLRPAIDTH